MRDKGALGEMVCHISLVEVLRNVGDKQVLGCLFTAVGIAAVPATAREVPTLVRTVVILPTGWRAVVVRVAPTALGKVPRVGSVMARRLARVLHS